MFNEQGLQHQLQQLTQCQRFCVAYSGGLDSHVLLVALARLSAKNPNFQCRAVHVNHGLSVNAQHWQDHCTQVCKNLNIDLQIYTLELKKLTQHSLEAMARSERYAVLAQDLQEDECLLTAHTMDDQAETLLLQLLRGAGVKGLAAMPEKKVFAQSLLLRPLLAFSRAQLEEYAQRHQLVWINDESNEDMRFARNYLRHQFLPVLKQRWPQALTTLQRSAMLCAEADALLTELAEQDYQQVVQAPAKINISKLLQLSARRQRNVLRYWIYHLEFPLPTQAVLQECLRHCAMAAADAQPCVQWGKVQLRRFRQHLYLMWDLSQHDIHYRQCWDMRKPLLLPNQLGELCAIRSPGEGLSCALLNEQTVEIRFRVGGEVCQPQGRREKHQLKKLFQEWQVPPWLRSRIPLVYCNEVIIAVVGYCVCEGFSAQGEQLGWQIKHIAPHC